MKKQIKQVQEFQNKFKQPVSLSPKTLSLPRGTLRFNLMEEENKEYLDAVKNSDLIEIADALGDMLYILCGTIIEHGMQDVIVDVFDEIQGSNMSKLGEDGEPILREDGKILKGKNYFKPNISKIMDLKKSILEEADNQLKICFCGNKEAGEPCDDSCKVVEKGDN
jgi:predicted HAD superfamily Cof-like phosphohydrolase